MHSIAIVIPYYGTWPEWINLFVETCRFNPTVDWLIPTDQPEPANQCPNVRFLPLSLEGFCDLASRKLDLGVSIPNLYKLCDYKVTYGKVFEDHLADYDYFGFGDLDVFYGNMRKLITDEALAHDVSSFHEQHVSGHLCLMRNVEPVKTLYQRIENVEACLNWPYYTGVDERGLTELTMGRDWAHFVESYNTPLSRSQPWCDGTYWFPAEWYWEDGVLTNNRDRRDFLYLHFMHWKGGHWAGQFGNAQWERLSRVVHFDDSRLRGGFRVNEKGIFRYNGRRRSPTDAVHAFSKEHVTMARIKIKDLPRDARVSDAELKAVFGGAAQFAGVAIGPTGPSGMGIGPTGPSGFDPRAIPIGPTGPSGFGPSMLKPVPQL